MTHEFKLIVMFILSIVLIGYGIIGVRRKQISFGLGGGRTGSAKPLFILVLDGLSASIFGVACIICGILFMFPTTYDLFSMNTVITEATVTVTIFVGIIIVIGGLVFASVIQFAMSLGEQIRKDSNHEDT